MRNSLCCDLQRHQFCNLHNYKLQFLCNESRYYKAKKENFKVKYAISETTPIQQRISHKALSIVTQNVEAGVDSTK